MNYTHHRRRPLTVSVLAALVGVTILGACGSASSSDSAGSIAPPTSSANAPTTPPSESARSAPAPTTAAPAPSASSPTSTQVEAGRRGELVGLRLQQSMPRAEVQALIDQVQIPGLTEAKYGLDVWRVSYSTIDVVGDKTVASGTMIVPAGAMGPLPVLSDQHGTQTARLADDAPLMQNELFGAGLLFATQGYLVVGADYLGLGLSTGMHPYYHAESEASAALDMLRASSAAAVDIGIAFSDELFLAGYSQGAHVTMALHRAIEQGDEFTVTASAPMAGAYDLDQVSVPTAIANPAVSTPLYLSYAVLGLNEAYGFIEDWNEVFQTPYVDTVAGLFDGTHEIADIVAALPADPAELFQPEFLTDVVAGRGEFAEALRANNLYDWAPDAPVRLYHGGADADVPFRNSEVAAARMTELGADVEIVNVGADLDHSTASTPSYIQAFAWFESFK